jgi:urea transport system substrate-binding protein
MIKRLLIQIAIVAIALALSYFFRYEIGLMTPPPIKVGVLHSLTGTMAVSEKSVKDGTLLAIKEINEQGGLLGRSIEAVIRDGKSDGPTFALAAEKLISEDKVDVVFGGWTSTSRKALKPIIEKFNHLLFYPLQYEGLETSPNIIYTGAAPNQQIIPAVKWANDHLGKSFFLVGSDYVFPRTANAIIKDQAALLDVTIVGEEYLQLGSSDVDAIVEKIVKAKPDVILNTINGESNIAFFKKLRGAGITSAKTPTMSFSIAEEELKSIGPKELIGDYACWNYFQSIDTEQNKHFVRIYKETFGQDRVTDDPIEAAYFGVYLWARAVQDALSTDPALVLKALPDQSYSAPEGMVYIDADTLHTWKTVRIGQIQTDGQFKIVWSSDKPIRPRPFPPYRTQAEWEKFLLQQRNG